MKIMKIYNSLTFQKEEFKTLRPNDVLMYVCGPTVYDSPHLGHAKSAVAFDIIRRYFRFKGYNVKMVKNYTDIDDKIIKRAKEINIDFKTLSDKYIKEYEEIMKILNIQKDYKNPRATDIIDFMIEFIEKLISKGHAYEKNGSVYFSVKSFPDYNKLLQNKRTEEGEEEDLEDQDTIYNDDKLDPRDFALWKKMKEGEPYWESPWGKGRPGWHIECSAMAINYLGETIDVHGGGQDLKFPHHRNEIAQSEAYTGKPFAKFFMHNGFVNVDNEKMSKSLGNFFLVSDVAKKFNPMVIRFFLISSHYRKSINYSLKTISQAKKNYDKLINTIQKINDIASEETDSIELENLISKIDIVKENIINAMDDDFNTAVAIAEIMSFFREINQIILEKNVKINSKFKDKFFNFIKDVDDIFGLFPKLKKELHLGIAGEFDDRGVLINNLLEIIKDIRSKLRERKIYDISDEIRKKLRDLGIKIEDPK
jgi:cysteinyl-tRNA synthetase